MSSKLPGPRMTLFSLGGVLCYGWKMACLERNNSQRHVVTNNLRHLSQLIGTKLAMARARRKSKLSSSIPSTSLGRCIASLPRLSGVLEFLAS